MSRPYSNKFLSGLETADDTYRIGYKMAKLCVEAKLPAKYVAVAMGVSRATIHNWFRGAVLRGKNEDIALAFIKLVREDLNNKVLPAKSVKSAKAYIEDMIGETISA
jgi:transcriptional regulator with XRE-family HTH domain